jgi:hypothetical protein
MIEHNRSNGHVADQLEQVADRLELLGRNPFRVRSYRKAADTVRETDPPVAERLEQRGLAGLKELPGIGDSLARAVRELVHTGRLGLLDRLDAEISPEALLTRVPGVGPKRAKRIHEELDIDSLEELELAAHDGRLADLQGMGPKTVAGVRDALAGRLSRSAGRRAEQRTRGPDRPDVAVLLDVDATYREKAEAGDLRTIAPRRFNPQGRSWLPVMRSRRDGWTFRVLFSNTARAHKLDKTRDWVVIYYERNGTENQCTVVTAGSGPLRGRRVVRGREAECRDYYEKGE